MIRYTVKVLSSERHFLRHLSGCFGKVEPFTLYTRKLAIIFSNLTELLQAHIFSHLDPPYEISFKKAACIHKSVLITGHEIKEIDCLPCIFTLFYLLANNGHCDRWFLRNLRNDSSLSDFFFRTAEALLT